MLMLIRWGDFKDMMNLISGQRAGLFWMAILSLVIIRPILDYDYEKGHIWWKQLM